MIAHPKPNTTAYMSILDIPPYCESRFGKKYCMSIITIPRRTMTARFVMRNREILLRNANIRRYIWR
jgi:hypothetical protein